MNSAMPRRPSSHGNLYKACAFGSAFGVLFLLPLGLSLFAYYRRHRTAKASRKLGHFEVTGDTDNLIANVEEGVPCEEMFPAQGSHMGTSRARDSQLLEELCSVGRNPAYVCSRPAAKSEAVGGAGGGAGPSSGVHGGGISGPGSGAGRGSALANDAGSSDEEEEEEDVDPASTVPSTPKAAEEGKGGLAGSATAEARTPVPLVDYILNVVGLTAV
ncbi:hypothetical protein IscW_ISCW017064 [Ixodes scapularis]|uniref:Uncharacterized protein n=1 Tax=Ixodes scapularis TaxID=6945 RepID=B7P7X5_IXOSC|nr:hypothetical protein IscW_ISCW017064 [Ixodes scapularis]|eukprot:XP_002400185.1 hypothetical protein IscW_ISCW017064 [Ixodes scapularis]